MKWRSLFAGLILFVGAASACPAWGSSAVPLDGNFRTGQLANGLTYFIQVNDLPKGQMHFALVQKPVRKPFYRQVLLSPSHVKEGVAQMERVLREQLITSPKQYRPHLMGVIIIGAFHADSVESLVRTRLSDLPATVDVMQAQKVPDGADSAFAAKAFSATPLPPVWQDGCYRMEISFPIPALSRELRAGNEFFVMDFLRHVMLYAAKGPLTYPAQVYAHRDMVWAARVHPDSLTEAFSRLARECVRLARSGVSQEMFDLAGEDYLRRETWRYKNSKVRTNRFIEQECIRHFFDGTPMAQAAWRYGFVSRMVPYVTLNHVNQYIRGILLSSEPGIFLYPATSAADSLMTPIEYLPAALQEERVRLEEELAGISFPFEEDRLMELSERILDIDLRLQLDSLQRSQVIPVIDADSLQALYSKVRYTQDRPFVPEDISVSEDLLHSGEVLRCIPVAHHDVSVWQLSGGSLLYVRPDTLQQGRIYFAAVEKDPIAFSSYVPGEGFRKYSGPLLWKQTTQGLLLYNTTTPDSLHTFLQEVARQIEKITRNREYRQGMWSEREKHIQSARNLSRNLLLDSLRVMLFEDRSPGKDAVPKGFDFICTGDVPTDSLLSWAEKYLAGILCTKGHTREPVAQGEGIRRGMHNQIIPFPNPAAESKAARLYSGPCPYTLEQYVLLQMLERLVEQSTDGAVSIQSSLEYHPRGHYFFYMGFSSDARDLAYNRHRLDQILANLAAFGPTQEQLEKARHSLLVEYKENQLDAAWHCRMLVGYSRSGRDFVTGYGNMLQQIDTAMVRDFVRQIMEYGNAASLVLSGATNEREHTSYVKNP
ncbi:MAG: insulinase family protein [Bacteroidales bacterium]|nr:insulinase family protein [Bacteroidales bacterium]